MDINQIIKDLPLATCCNSKPTLHYGYTPPDSKTWAFLVCRCGVSKAGVPFVSDQWADNLATCWCAQFLEVE